MPWHCPIKIENMISVNLLIDPLLDEKHSQLRSKHQGEQMIGALHQVVIVHLILKKCIFFQSDISTGSDLRVLFIKVKEDLICCFCKKN